ncbi:GNAT family N-acetyltransferase [Alteromonas sp. C1M14]|uniref:GNAT family N-acetyltransferase n=1 Tax=Alteromonas sp. C1M14 TaxID=2841567 RepID=UPI001C084191|nr:GNAT family N-acetyltransferase [Alteromonas sp. C1M14]MBU2977571.1 GNAT family N-acetyltransferase [Alteromonas sp. C1M14]
MGPLSTTRLLLRLPNKHDRNWIFALNHDPLWLRFIGNRGVHTLSDANTYIDNVHRHFSANGYGLFVIENKMNHRPLGMCGLINRNIFSAPDLGFALLPQGRGQGVGLEAGRRVVKFARETLSLPYLTAMTHIENRASQQLLSRLGFVQRGTLFLPSVTPQRFYWLHLT